MKIAPSLPAALTRRRFLGVAAAGLVTACGTSTPPPAPADPWTFIDDRGTTVELPARPQRVVAYETAASALWSLGVVPAGIFAGSRLADSPSLAGFDLGGVTPVGETYGQLDMEALAALRPELIVTAYDERQDGPLFGFGDAAMQERVGTLAPIVAIEGTQDPLAVIGRFEELAAALGADLKAPDVTAARQRFDEASAQLSEALAAKPGLLAVACTTFDNQIYFARPDTFPGLRRLRGLGLQLVEPEGGAPDPNTDFMGYFWDVVSYELAAKYPADLILYDREPSAAQAEELAAIPTMQGLAAVRAGQFAPWRKLEDWSYRAYTADLEAILAAVRTADPALVT